MKFFIIALLAACGPSRHAEVVVLANTPPSAPWQAMRRALDNCARSFELTGDLQVRVEIGNAGKVIAVNSDYNGGFSQCVGTALLHARFRQHEGRVLQIAFAPGGS